MKFELIAAREIPRLTARREVEMYAIYEYMLDTFGPFTFEVPKREDTQEKFKAAVAEKEAYLTGVRGG